MMDKDGDRTARATWNTREPHLKSLYLTEFQIIIRSFIYLYFFVDKDNLFSFSLILTLTFRALATLGPTLRRGEHASHFPVGVMLML